MTSLIYFECKKIFGNFKWLILVGIIIVKAVITYSSLNVSADFSIEIYKDYISQLSQMSQTEAELYVPKEAQRIESIVGAKVQMENDYSSGAVTLDEYKAYMKKYYEADSKSAAFAVIQTRYEQFFELDRSERVWYYDLEWRAFGKMLSLDFCLLFALFIFCIPVYCREYSSGVHTLNMVSKNGRVKLHIAKLLVIIISSLLFALLIYSVDFAVMGAKFGLDNYDRPLRAMIDHGSAYDSMSILKFFVLQSLSKALWAVCAALSLSVISVIAKNIVISTVISAAFILIPVVTVPTGSKLNNYCIGVGLKGSKYHVNLLTPFANILIWLAITIAVMLILYPIHKKSAAHKK